MALFQRGLTFGLMSVEVTVSTDEAIEAGVERVTENGE